jgi:hypothetical protein
MQRTRAHVTLAHGSQREQGCWRLTLSLCLPPLLQITQLDPSCPAVITQEVPFWHLRQRWCATIRMPSFVAVITKHEHSTILA